jgi:hypothetical membrane protein
VVPCHHGIVADRGEGLQIWRIAANILNKQSWTANKNCPSDLGVGRLLTTPYRKRTAIVVIAIIIVIKSLKMRFAGHVARIEVLINIYNILACKSGGKRPLLNSCGS